jgi:hypothetical protein
MKKLVYKFTTARSGVFFCFYGPQQRASPLLRYVPRLANARPRLRRVWPAAAGHRYTSLGR